MSAENDHPVNQSWQVVSEGETDGVPNKEIIGNWPGVDNKDARASEIKAKY